jgi:hypothetical protein
VSSNSGFQGATPAKALETILVNQVRRLARGTHPLCDKLRNREYAWSELLYGNDVIGQLAWPGILGMHADGEMVQVEGSVHSEFLALLEENKNVETWKSADAGTLCSHAFREAKLKSLLRRALTEEKKSNSLNFWAEAYNTSDDAQPAWCWRWCRHATRRSNSIGDNQQRVAAQSMSL